MSFSVANTYVTLFFIFHLIKYKNFKVMTNEEQNHSTSTYIYQEKVDTKILININK